MQFGFVIDHSRCIGCHACTVACKSENEVPVGSFRTWVKYTETGTFPEVRRSFAVLRCNQCTAAPCVTICPVVALDKRPDGIVDVDPDRCIGCKSCMQACPYDALYINEDKGTAEKCHFCAHRTERGLAPACAVVCPTEAIIPGDFHDPESVVSKMRAAGGLEARKTEAGTGPNVFYRDVSDAGIDPSLTNTSGGYLWANQVAGVQMDAQTFEALEEHAQARTTYDVNHVPLWGWKVSAYLFTKSIAAGLFLAILPLILQRQSLGHAGYGYTLWSALAFLVVTAVLLVADLKRPERFLYVLLKPNWSSWLTRGALLLSVYGACIALWLYLHLSRTDVADTWVGAVAFPLTAFAAAGTAMYTAWLFGQAKGRVLWMRRGLSLHLLAQAVVAGSAWILLAAVMLSHDAVEAMRVVLGIGLLVHGALTLVEGKLAPARREKEYHRASRLVTHGPFARRHWFVGVILGILVPLIGVLIAPNDITLGIVGALALYGLWVEEDILVRAGQALPIS